MRFEDMSVKTGGACNYDICGACKIWLIWYMAPCYVGPLIDEPSPLKRNKLPKVVKAANMDRIWQVGLVSGHTWLNKMLLLKEEGAKGVNSDTEVQSAQHQLYPFVRWDSKHFLTIHYWSVWQFKAKNSLVLSFVTTFIAQNFWDQDDFQFNPEHIHGWNAAVYRCKMGRYGTCQMF